MAKTANSVTSRQRRAGRTVAEIDFEKRARAKFLTLAFVRPLSEIEDSTCRSGYINTLDCATTVRVHDGKATSHYCKNRWCLVCNRIRCAVLLNQYLPQLQVMTEPMHLVLTNTNCAGDELREQIARFLAWWRVNYKRAKKRKLHLYGLKKFECTYNPLADTYHPHYHIAIDGRNNAEFFLKQWLSYWQHSRHPADALANKIFPIDGAAGFLEFFKYFTKVVTKIKTERDGPDIDAAPDITAGIFIEPLNVIMQAMKGRRVFEAFGMKAIKNEDEIFDQLAAVDVSEFLQQSYSFEWYNSDWFNGIEQLSGYQPSEEMLNLTNKIIF